MHASLRGGDVEAAQAQNGQFHTFPAQKNVPSQPWREATDDWMDTYPILRKNQKSDQNTRELWAGGATFNARLLKGIWYADQCWGVSLQATDLMQGSLRPRMLLLIRGASVCRVTFPFRWHKLDLHAVPRARLGSAESRCGWPFRHNNWEGYPPMGLP